ncbi:hypothetical protein BACCAP_04126 [Pseudoflavonifractor capillosus ATCC 29799]|uniref:Uncharacterized protein n=1 Tax=Pseudoflavonifractor capillosus ATCC 29799 TaxID=411467 RepID=A6P0V9_9FIRM|nr:hypothetical protein BACCAP_04126 [Pseudoflavonifractor capillosus ATCC 29799]
MGGLPRSRRQRPPKSAEGIIAHPFPPFQPGSRKRGDSQPGRNHTSYIPII